MTKLQKMRVEELHALSDFRYELRRFLRVSEKLCKAEGVTPLQYQMLLQTRANRGRSWILVGELASRLQSAPHGVVALVFPPKQPASLDAVPIRPIAAKCRCTRPRWATDSCSASRTSTSTS